ncbi:Prolamin-like domain-containing protein [Artemisia annua]|uniref:Prolamin-like domain-containing protein n=1 Tax=Artemisia annua TaxID=35608 RepID=A0A2U1QDP6_ARTAN|nr:Prolamin-like domain-containing protein [Artemisia annua]
MAEIKVLSITLLLLFCLVTSESSSMARKMDEIKPGKDLVSRINGEKDKGGLMDCWNALLELKSCTNEIILFLLNGDSYLTIDCCRAIRIITYGCWPSMLTSLGFTSEEGDILKGYCGAAPLPQPVMFEGPNV